MNGWRSHIMQAWIMHSSHVYCHACISPAVTGSQCIFAIHCCFFVFLAKDLERKDALFFVLLKSFSLHWFPDTKIGPVPQGLIPVSFPSCGLLIFLSHLWILWVLCFYLHCSIYILLIVFICVCCVSVCVCVCTQFLNFDWLCNSVARQCPLSMRFSRQEYWSGLPFLTPGELPNPGIKSTVILYHCTTDAPIRL